jgi:hypothetical protein
MLKRDLISLKVNYPGGVSITHWPKECEPGLTIDGNGKMRPKFLEKTNESELQGEEGRQYSKEGKKQEKY